eukprot:CAMPEP_0197532874 /NCGR_PEP_ID=MMETSP1318-20131121/41270_1 /TAXON_ID=552666 /ORGANISM="Partenskyella glossopodia, Strain RCC365" /LENGTH=115 /DNA_ID=CAMNT_0043089565 /DNA_START=74 /DNA_END=421 /DNA_ORIENTATION=+
MEPSKVPDHSVWEGRFVFRGKLPNPPKYFGVRKEYISGNRSAKCPEVGATVEVSKAPSPEVQKSVEFEAKMNKLKKQIETAAKEGDFEKVMDLSSQMKQLHAEANGVRLRSSTET